MKQVQDALAGIGIDVFADAYRAKDASQAAPESYVVYVVRAIEIEHQDDEPTALRTFVYMNLWTKKRPQEYAKRIRKAMRAAGFGMDEESTGNTQADANYSEGVRYYNVNWTWTIEEAIDDGD